MRFSTCSGKSAAHPDRSSDGPFAFLGSLDWLTWQTVRAQTSAINDCACAELLAVEQESSRARWKQANLPECFDARGPGIRTNYLGEDVRSNLMAGGRAKLRG